MTARERELRAIIRVIIYLRHDLVELELPKVAEQLDDVAGEIAANLDQREHILKRLTDLH